MNANKVPLQSVQMLMMITPTHFPHTLNNSPHTHRAKEVTTILALNTTKYLKDEREYIPWESALDNLDYFFLMFDRSEVLGPMQVGLINSVSKVGPLLSSDIIYGEYSSPQHYCHAVYILISSSSGLPAEPGY